MIHFGESGPLDETLEWYGIPKHMYGAITRYIVDGIHPGDFLYSVLSNDLRESVAHADSENQAALVQWVKWLYNEAPLWCWGSPKRVEDWMQKKHEARQCAKVQFEIRQENS